jgi:3-oxoacyl-[acyl-carrier-protein] synthase-3
MLFKFEGLNIEALASAIPCQSEGISEWKSFFDNTEICRLTQQTRIKSVRKSHYSSMKLGTLSSRLLYKRNKQPDAIISVTQTPERLVPGNASGIASAMGWTKGTERAAPLCWDLQMGCSGMVWGLYQAAMLLQQDSINEVLLVCSETHSRLVNPSDRATRLLFGDGATAMRLTKQAKAGQEGTWTFELGTQPDGAGQLCTKADGFLHMDGLGIFDFAVGTVVPALEKFIQSNGLSKDQISTYLMHQASGLVLQYMQRMMQIPPDRMPIALDGYGNSGSASIGILLAHHFAGTSHPELRDAIMVGFGSGLQWGFLKADLSQTKIHPILTIDSP